MEQNLLENVERKNMSKMKQKINKKIWNKFF
jgi:hypothetical protein